MKNKWIFTRVLVACLLLCTMCVPALGAQEDSKGLEQAIVSAKKNITVPESFTDFTNHSSIKYCYTSANCLGCCWYDLRGFWWNAHLYPWSCYR